MSLFHVDVVIYALYLLFAFPKIKADLSTDLVGNKEDIAIKIILMAMFAFFIFVVVLKLSQSFPLVMFFFLLFNLFSILRKRK
jgi:succinate-acetate transporter protein